MSRARIGLRIGGIVLVVGVVVALGVAWFLHNYEKVENELHLPPRGEAAYNPLYALKKTLQADGVTVASRQRLDLSTQTLAAGDTLLILNDPRTLTPVESRRLLEWVASGGHLLVRTPVPGRWDKDMQIPLFKTLGVRTLVADTDCEPFQVEGEDHHVEFCRGRRFTFDEVEPLLSWGDLGKGYVYARLGHGEGQVDVLADFDFLANNGDRQRSIFLPETDKPVGGLRDGPHRALARQVLAPNYGKGTMHLVYAAQMPSLWRSVLQQGWPVWAPLLLALLAWLASRAQTFRAVAAVTAGRTPFTAGTCARQWRTPVSLQQARAAVCGGTQRFPRAPAPPRPGIRCTVRRAAGQRPERTPGPGTRTHPRGTANPGFV